jgi:hypothetical protein
VDDETVDRFVLAELTALPAGCSVGGAGLRSRSGATEREIRAAISHLRQGGRLIVGDWSGYRMATNAQEVYACVAELAVQIRALQSVADGMLVAVGSLKFGGS